MKFSAFIKEELTPELKKQADRVYVSSAYDISNHLFDQSHRLTIPLMSNHGEHYAPHSVRNHLEENGFLVHNYKEGLAQSMDGRLIKIGKVLQRTKAPDHVVKAFVNDSQRKAVTHNDLNVVISRHPHDVIGMSYDRGWRSCMSPGDPDDESSMNVFNEIRHGTHVAYLTHAHDTEVKNPIARIALKPFAPFGKFSKARRMPKDTVLRPEQRIYGSGGTAFTDTVRAWSEHHFPIDPHQVYVKHAGVYDDDSMPYMFHNSLPTFKSILDEGPQLIHAQHDPIHLGAARRALGYRSNEEIEKHFEHPTILSSVNMKMTIGRKGIKSLNDRLIHDSTDAVRAAVAQGGHEEHLDKLMKDRSHRVRLAVARFGTEDHRATLMHDFDPFVRQEVAAHTRDRRKLEHLANDKVFVTSQLAKGRLADMGA